MQNFPRTYHPNMKYPGKIIFILNGILLLALLTHSIYRDVHLEKQYTVDLRNRVVGARLQKDGKLPYNYKYQQADGLRYFDFQNLNNDTAGISNVTASPFFHELLFPICDLPEATISKIWLWLQYILLACMIFMFSTLTHDTKEKLLVLNLGIVFTATEAWKSLIKCGQLYLVVAFLICCIITGLLSNKKSGIVLAGICAIAFVLIRPFGMVLFIPFLIRYKKNLLFLAVAFSGLFLYILFVFNNPYEKSLYLNYAGRMKMHVLFHQNALVNPPGIPKADMLSVRSFEGIDFKEAELQTDEHPIKVYSENGNIFILYYYITHKKIPLTWIYLLSSGIILLLTTLFYFHQKKYPYQKIQILLLGFTMYMIVELFGPITRHQYNTVQWFPLVLAGFMVLPGWFNRISFLLLSGLVLNIVNVPWLPMRHTVGEFCWLASMILLIFSSRPKPAA
jgi:Glycosyltransferase family 87